MPTEVPRLTDLTTALRAFAFTKGTQSAAHIKPLHWYTACRLVVEGGFLPDYVRPRPPLRVERRGACSILHHDPASAKGGERTLLGGLKTKQIDVSVALPGVGPVVAVSLKGAQNAPRNLTNRMEEAGGDCTNLHLSYPALVYGYWCVMRANAPSDATPIATFGLSPDGRYQPTDLTIDAAGSLAEIVRRFAHALERLSDRRDLREEPSRYEACGLTLVRVEGGPAATAVHAGYPGESVLLEFNRMFVRLYEIYDQRYVYQAPDLRRVTARAAWDPSSPVLVDTVLSGGAFDEWNPRLAS